jgi:hypothetical protein
VRKERKNMSGHTGDSGDTGGGRPPSHPGGDRRDHKKPDRNRFFGGPLASKGGGGTHKGFDKPQSVSSGAFWLGTSIISLLLIVVMVMVYGMTQDLRDAGDGIARIDDESQKISKEINESSGQIQDLIIETGNSIKKKIEKISVLPRRNPTSAKARNKNGKRGNLGKMVDKRVDDRLDKIIGERVAKIREDLERLRQESRKRKVVIQLVKER